MKFSIGNGFFIPGPSLAAEKQGLGLKFSIENESFKPRIKISSENENFVRGGMVFSCVRARMIPGPSGKEWPENTHTHKLIFGTHPVPGQSRKFVYVSVFFLSLSDILYSETPPKGPENRCHPNMFDTFSRYLTFFGRFLLCPLSRRKLLWNFFFGFAWGFCIEKCRGFLVNFFLVSVSHETKHENSSKNSGKTRSKIRGKIRDGNSKNSGNFRSATFLT